MEQQKTDINPGSPIDEVYGLVMAAVNIGGRHALHVAANIAGHVSEAAKQHAMLEIERRPLLETFIVAQMEGGLKRTPAEEQARLAPAYIDHCTKIEATSVNLEWLRSMYMVALNASQFRVALPSQVDPATKPVNVGAAGPLASNG